jgi:predicted RNase H-like HicB family nuclease
MAVRRFEEIIGGRVYQIEAAEVRDNRWRAQIVRIPGVPTAMMPFYGATPDEAARNLREWLARAHRSITGAP